MYVSREKERDKLYQILLPHTYFCSDNATTLSKLILLLVLFLKEMIAEMENLVYDMLVEFDETTCDGKAKQIIFYRDGVSEGQFREVY